jgi:hypothetical protein
MQDSMDVPEGTRLLDWTNLEGSVGVLAEKAIEEARKYLSSTNSDGGLRINDLLGDLIGKAGILDFDFDEVSFEVEDFVVEVKTARVKGLDSFSRFEVLEPVAPQTLQNFVQLDSLAIEVDLHVGFISANEAPREITLSFEVNDINAEIGIFAAFDLEKLGALELGSLLHVRNILPCILSTAYGVSIPQMNISVGSFLEPTVEGLMPDTGAAASTSIAAVVERFRSEIEEAIPLVFGRTVRQVANALLESYRSDLSCPDPEPTTSAEYVDFRQMFLPRDSTDIVRPFGDLLLSGPDSRARGGSGNSRYGNLIRTLIEVARKQFLQVDPMTGVSAVNSMLVSPLTEAQSTVAGSLFFTGDLFNQQARLSVGGLDARIKLRAYDAFVNNMDTFGAPLSLLDSVVDEPSHLNNTASLGIGRPLQLGARFLFGLKDDGKFLTRAFIGSNDMDLSLSLPSLLCTSRRQRGASKRLRD